MFYAATSFNQDLSRWAVGAGESMGSMFEGATQLGDCNKVWTPSADSVLMTC